MSPPSSGDMHPPRAAERLLEYVAGDDEFAEGLIGDLREEVARGDRGALWYWREAIVLSARLAVMRLTRRRPTARGRHLDTPSSAVLMDTLLHDLRFACRLLVRRRTFATMAIATIALGIGAATAMFSVIDGIVLRALPYREPERLVLAWRTFPDWVKDPSLKGGWDRINFTYPEYRSWRERHPSFADVGVWLSSPMTLAGAGTVDGVPEEVSVLRASSSLLPMLGTRITLGRTFLPGEDQFGGASVTMLSHETWTRRYAADTGILGRVVALNGRTRTVVGVLPPHFRLVGERSSRPQEFWVPAGQEAWDTVRNNRNYQAIARLKPGVPLERARVELDQFLHEEWTYPSATSARVADVKLESTKAVRSPLTLLFASAGLLLLIACGNVATLLLGEAAARDAEIAARTALGAGRGRLVRQLLTEHLLLALAGTAIGLVIAYAGTRVLVTLAPADTPRLGEVGLQARSLLFAAGAAVLTALVFGLAPIVTLLRTTPATILRATSDRARVSRSAMQRAGLASQLALSVMMLVVAALVGRSLLRLSAVDPGFGADGLVYVRVHEPEDRYPTGESRLRLREQLVEQMRGLPGLQRVSAGLGIPFGDGPSGTSIRVADTPGHVEPLDVDAQFRVALPGFIETLGIPILAGRKLEATDDERAPRVVLVNETMARRFWPHSTAVGKRIFVDKDWRDVVGVVRDVKHSWLNSETLPTFYLPAHQTGRVWGMTLALRVDRPLADIAPAMRMRIREVDPTVAIARIEMVSTMIQRSLTAERYRTTIIVFFAGAALLLACVGIYGVTAGAVSRRLREMAIRMALGASERSVVGLVLRSTMVVACIGAITGTLGALALSGSIERFLFGVTARDAGTYGTVIGFLAVVTLAMSWLPARRATRAEPATVLRGE